jgi:hypothetical protein
LDENDHIPLTTEPVYWVHVAENSPPRTPVARITAIDGDRHSKLTYQLKAGNPQSLFDIDPNTGNVIYKQKHLSIGTYFHLIESQLLLRQDWQIKFKKKMGKENLDDDYKSCGFSPFDLSSRISGIIIS